MQKFIMAATVGAALALFAFAGQPARADSDDGPKAKHPGECGFNWYWSEKLHKCVDATA